MSATPAKVKSLVDELIQSVTGLTAQEDPENFNLCRDFALRNFRGYKFGRTNQFDVTSKLDGLEEKFRVFNRDDLADAFRSRLEELPSLTSGFTPEILSLFLSLSDRPLQNSKISDLELLAKSDAPKEPTWEDIIADDPMVGEIWEDVDFGAESSDEWSDDGYTRPRSRDGFVESLRNQAEDRRRKPQGTGDGEARYKGSGVEGFIVQADEKGLESLKKAQYWSEGVLPVERELDVSLASGGVNNISLVSELQAMREVIFMLLGYPCLLFQRKPNDTTILVNTDSVTKHFALSHASLPAFRAILSWYAGKGTNINVIRTFARSKTSTTNFPERQTFVASVCDKLAILDQHLIKLEELLLVGSKGLDQIVSLLALQGELEPFLTPFDLLSDIIAKLPQTGKPPADLALQHLESLFQLACRLQSTGDQKSFKFIMDIFFSCLQTYLRPIHQWMESGELRKDDEVFLISKTRSDEEVELGGLWSDQYSLRKDVSGVLKAPEFVHAAAARIFITGKSVVFLKRLLEHGIPSSALPLQPQPVNRIDVNLSTACKSGEYLAPFSDMFAAAFDKWINDRHHSVSSRLRDILYQDCGLWKSLDAIEHIYLCKNGHLFDTLSQAMFEKVDKGVQTWGDRFLLTELLQGIYGGVGCVEVGRMRMRAKPESTKSLRERRRTVKMWKSLELSYALPWPIMNVIRKESFDVYNNIFSFLLQIRRAKYVLERLTLLKEDFRTLGESGEGAMYYSLKHRLLWFANIIYYYLTNSVLIPQTTHMRQEMARAVHVDGMIQVHNTYIQKTKEQCLLGAKLAPIHQAITSILDISIFFSDAHLAHSTALKTLDAPNASIHDISVFISSHNPRRRHRRRQHQTGEPYDYNDISDSNSDSEDYVEDNFEGMNSYISFENEAYARQIGHMSERFNTLLEFVRAGLRGVARAGVMPHLEVLAESLEGPGRGGGT
ncbi:unnamed protein product [Tuber melanosporum]|uniref:Spindle pole body component n=1 Tax=Tuber melanosporum (strain Mel28) TaxID=656061 RepID=D5GJS5_TUBMM|nr:uncharacterized protein GSTUM_00009172001 [Tuber melanosporum]CAZ84768.1 unnamed protein product [Tuber melanosporum]